MAFKTTLRKVFEAGGGKVIPIDRINSGIHISIEWRQRNDWGVYFGKPGNYRKIGYVDPDQEIEFDDMGNSGISVCTKPETKTGTSVSVEYTLMPVRFEIAFTQYRALTKEDLE